MDIMIQHHLFNVEIMERENRKIVAKNGFTAGTILIEDLEELGTGHMFGKVVKLITGIAARDEVSYPESIRKVYIVNPPGVFQLVWGIMKPFIEDRTLAKFSFGSAKDFKDEWDKIIGLDKLPKYLGGALEFDFPSGGSVKPLTPTSNLQTVEIPRRGCHVHEVSAAKGQELHVEFLIKSGKDIGFGVYIKKGSLPQKKDITSPRAFDGHTPVEEYKLKKIDEEITPFHCHVVAPGDHTYVVFFDNSDSMLLGRDITFHHYLTDPFEIKGDSMNLTDK